MENRAEPVAKARLGCRCQRSFKRGHTSQECEAPIYAIERGLAARLPRGRLTPRILRCGQAEIAGSQFPPQCVVLPRLLRERVKVLHRCRGDLLPELNSPGSVGSLIVRIEYQ